MTTNIVELRRALAWLILRNKLRGINTLILCMSVIILPSIAFASGSAALHMFLAEESPVTNLAGKDLSYWLLAVAAMSISSWTLAVKYLVGQLESQRAANVDLTGKLLNYMSTDHTTNLNAMVKLETALVAFTHQLERFVPLIK